MKISFIVPIYKTPEKNFIKLIDSFKKQKFKNLFECIFVIDEIDPKIDYDKLIQELKHDINYKIINNEKNLGSGESRNIGIDNANGRYLSFVDSDDNISANYVEKVINFLYKNNVDLIRINYTDNNSCEDITYMDNYKNFKKSITPGWASYTMIINKTFLVENKIKFLSNSNYGEDIYLFLLIMCNVSNWYEINLKLYFYNRSVEGSITQKMHVNYFKSFSIILKIIKKTKMDINYRLNKKIFCYFKRYIWLRLIRNGLFSIFRINRDNI